MKRLAALLLMACAPAWAQTALPVPPREPAPRPICWPSDFCAGDASDMLNPLCGTGSTAMVVQQEGVGTSIEWACKHPDGIWRTAGLIRPWLAPLVKPTKTALLTKGVFGALWDANAVVTSADEAAKYAALEAKARPLLAHAWRPLEAPPPLPVAWVVAPVSTGLRPSYLIAPSGVPIRETGQFVPTMTAGKPTPCDCDGAGNSSMLAAQNVCAVRGFKTPAGVQRVAACQAAK